MVEYIFPVRIVKADGTGDAHILLKKQPLQIGLSEQRTVPFASGDHLILDFGSEMCGGIRILTLLGARTPRALTHFQAKANAISTATLAPFATSASVTACATAGRRG